MSAAGTVLQLFESLPVPMHLVPRVASSAQHEVCSSREHRSPLGLLWSVGRRAQGFAGRVCSPRGQDGRDEEAALCTSEPYHLRGERRGQQGTRPSTRDLPPLDSRAKPVTALPLAMRGAEAKRRCQQGLRRGAHAADDNAACYRHGEANGDHWLSRQNVFVT